MKMNHFFCIIVSLLYLITIAHAFPEDDFFEDDDDDYDNMMDLDKSKFLSEWHCETIADIGLIIRYYNGEVECLSKDGRNCIWNPKFENCEELIKQYGSGETSLPCGEKHKKLFGTIGYSYPNHWCAKAAKNLYPFLKYAITEDWRCDLLKSLGVIVRYVNGDIECLSHDGVNCIWNTTYENCLVLTHNQQQLDMIKPLICGEHHNDNWTGPGYNTPGHWCAKALRFYLD